MSKKLSIIFCILSALTCVNAQTTPRETPLPGIPDQSNRTVEEIRKDNPSAFGGSNSKNPYGIYGSQDKMRAVDRETQPIIRTLSNKKTLADFRLVVPPSYHSQYGQILKDKSYKLAVIATIDPKCYKSKVMSSKDYEDCQKALDVWGGGSSYSFRNDTNYDVASNNWSDVRILNNQFEVGSRFIQGIISEIGNVEIEKLNLNSAELKYLVEFKPERNILDVVNQRTVIAKGIKANGFFYSTQAPIKLHSTYLLRTIAFDHPVEEWMNRKDLIVAFKIVGIESDNRVIILWKELKKSRSPVLKCKGNNCY